MALSSEQQAFVAWLIMEKRQRMDAGLPLTQADFAEMHGVSPRTLRRWKGEDEFAAALEERRSQEKARQKSMVLASEQLSEVAEHASGSGDGMFAMATQMLQQLIESGDTQALRLAFQTVLEPHVEAEKQRHQSDFRDLSDEELWDEVLVVVPDEWLAEACRQRGFEVVAGETPAEPAEDQSDA